MKKILIMVLSAIASLGVAFGTTLAFSADEVYISSLDDLNGTTIVFNSNIDGSVTPIGLLSLNFVCDSVSYTGLQFDEDHGEISIFYKNNDVTLTAYSNSWIDSVYKTISISDDNDFTDVVNSNTWIAFFNAYISSFTPAAPPEPAGNLWTSILTGIGGFLSGMFALISGAFTGVVSVFYANNTATIILQALIFAAAAGLVAAAVYVIVRLIKSAVARLRGGVGAAGAKGDKNKKTKRFFFRKRR